MTDAQDTIELPVFGLTLTRATELGDGWYGKGALPRICAKRGDSHDYVNVSLQRGGCTVTYSSACTTVDAACRRLLAEMTPDDVAAVRALGEP